MKNYLKEMVRGRRLKGEEQTKKRNRKSRKLSQRKRKDSIGTPIPLSRRPTLSRKTTIPSQKNQRHSKLSQ